MTETHPQGKVECPECHFIFTGWDHRAKHLGVCERCGDDFESKNPLAKFCGKRCRIDEYNDQRRTGNPTGRPRKS